MGTIRIISCLHKGFWYTEKIGQVFECMGISEHDIQVKASKDKYDYNIYHVRREDCIFLDEERQQKLDCILNG